MKKYSFGLRGHDIGNNFSQMCINANEYKIDTLQFALAKTCSDINFDAVGYDKSISLQINEELQKYKLRVAVLGCYINPVDKNPEMGNIQLQRFKNFLNYAKDFNADVIGTETGSAGTLEETHSKENYLKFLNNMSPLVKKAEELGVTIAIEPVWCYTIHSVEIMKKMLEDMKSPNLSVILDVSNMLNNENYETQNSVIEKAFDYLGDKISTIHLKDFDVVNGNKVFAPAGTGLLNTELLFKNIELMKKTPQIILDELPLAMYNETIKRLSE